MSLTSLLPAGAAALGVLTARTVQGLSDGLSFGSLLADSPVQAEKETAPPEPSLDEQLAAFAETLQRRLAEQGIQLSQPVTLKQHGSQGVIVDGDHPDRVAIEEVFAQDSQLAADFQQLAATATRVRDRSYSPLGGTRLGEFRLQVAGESLEIGFE